MDIAELNRRAELGSTPDNSMPALALGRIYSRGADIAKNENLARKWYAVAAEFDGLDCDELAEAKVKPQR